MAHLPRGLRGGGRGVADEHPEAGPEGRHGRLVRRIGDVVHRDAADAFQPFAGDLRHALEGAVARAEVQDCGPVVGEVLGEGAAGAGGERGEVVRERGVEGVPADDLVEVWGGDGAWVDEGVEAVDDELGAFEAHHGGGAGRGALGGAEGGG